MIKQYKEIKEKYKDYILFFRLGDFYEMFFEDAFTASRELEIALTSRDSENKVPMAGIPYHAADQYIAKLIDKGYKIAICEQMEDPKLARNIVKREVVKIITPGTVTDINFLDEKKNNYLCTIYKSENKFGLAFADILTGEFITTEISAEDNFQEVINELYKFSPTECIVNDEILNTTILKKNYFDANHCTLTLKEENYFDVDFTLLSNNFDVDSLKALEGRPFSLKASCACLKFLIETQMQQLQHFNNIRYYEPSEYMILDANTKRSLELTESLFERKRQGSLFWVLDKTQTAMGARLLRKWIEQPLIDPIKIKERLDAVEELFENFFKREELKNELKNIYDLERLTGKLVCGNVNARDLLAIKNTISRFPRIKNLIKDFSSKLIRSLEKQLDSLHDIFDLLDRAINEDPPLSVKEGNIIKDGFDENIDKLRKIAFKGKDFIAEFEAKERERTGIKSLKVGYNKVFGYYIEITKANLNLVPEDYIRKQTLANAERYITEQLKEYEEMILGAEEKLMELEYKMFCEIKKELLKNINRFKTSALSIATLDVLLSFAQVARDNNYVKPEITTGNEIVIIEGRHPVVELTLKNDLFIPNDTYINCKDSMISIITGPNMAGKSTYLRQVALIVLMSQIGSFVPAKKAIIGIVDRIFTRIGAYDNLAYGQSTFMVEMMEVANILKNATPKSLIILDEVGRGTSTYDGLSIAWAVVEYIHKNVKAKTLFATHYHEITKLKELFGIKNYKVTVKEKGDEILFLRKIIPGEADKSYGIEVAKLAGLPKSLIKRASELLKNLEKSLPEKSYVNNSGLPENDNEDSQLDLEKIKNETIIQKLRDIDINTMTPLEALNFLYKLKMEIL
ncbi:DNA mismatch repair protein MutS [Thermovenabulum gondwanense]|uniref:DNA mismatch repair protein MutS n=2 Tax=Thermovenabulum gondwanense TaxID=520767 RepID=A0A162M7E7_9FIRM|nr:DNA mismatch repair protein MutS [Thermovenabulum gondwanense]